MYVFFFFCICCFYYYYYYYWRNVMASLSTYPARPASDMLSTTNNYLELYGRELLRSSKRISNLGCYATSSQFLIAPVNHIKSGLLPTVFVNYSKTISILYNASLSKQ